MPNVHDKVPASIDALRDIVANHQCVKFVWPRHENPKMRRPRLVDAVTANAMVSVFDAVNDDNKAKFARMIAASPAQFMKVAEFCLSRYR